MREQPNHMKAGLMFVGVCIALAVMIYVVVQSRRAESTVTDNTVVSDYAPTANEAAADVDTDNLPNKSEVSSNVQAAIPKNAPREFSDLGLEAGQSYESARRHLYALGFSPAAYDHQTCAPYGTAPGEPCADRPEIVACTGQGREVCSSYWLRSGRILRVEPVGGPNGTLDSVETISRQELDDDLSLFGSNLIDATPSQ